MLSEFKGGLMGPGYNCVGRTGRVSEPREYSLLSSTPMREKE